MKRRVTGFTLIEVLITVAIVAILVAVGLPAYQEQVAKSRRAEGKVALLKTVQLQERFYTAQAAYATQTQLGTLYGLAAGTAVRSGENPEDPTGWYEITVTAPAGCVAADGCVTLTATPRFVDANCNVLTLDSRGVKTATGTKGVAYCWG